MSTVQATTPDAEKKVLRGQRKKGDRSGFLNRHGSQMLVVVSELILVAGFSIASPYFLQVANFSALLLDASVYVLLALGLTFVIATGGIDLTPGFGIAFTGVCLAVAMKWAAGAGMGTALVIVIGVGVGLLAGALMGTINGVLVAYLRMQPMIATLAMMLIAWGMAMVISGTSAIPLSEFDSFLRLGQGRTLGVTNALYLIAIVAAVAAYLLNRTLIGINKVYDLHFASISRQVTTIEEINAQTRDLAAKIEEVNQIYARMVQTLNIMGNPYAAMGGVNAQPAAAPAQQSPEAPTQPTSAS